MVQESCSHRAARKQREAGTGLECGLSGLTHDPLLSTAHQQLLSREHVNPLLRSVGSQPLLKAPPLNTGASWGHCGSEPEHPQLKGPTLMQLGETSVHRQWGVGLTNLSSGQCPPPRGPSGTAPLVSLSTELSGGRAPG